MTRSRSLLGALALLACVPALAEGQAVRARSSSPHGTLEAAIACTACHTTEAWKPARRDMEFNHDEATRFPLLGRHAQAACGACHLDLRFDEPKFAANDCAGCHVDVHQGRLSTDCATCHNTTTFTGVSGLEAHARTRFPLTGVHLQIHCETCHRDERAGAFTALDASCAGCHAADRQRAVFPAHAGEQFTDCLQCHQTSGWAGARFDHAAVANGFVLTGAHARASCDACHIPPDNRLRFSAAGQNDCVGCHRADYDREHGRTGFPVTCTDCHNDRSWRGATFDHDRFFPIFSGGHRGEWRACQDCHQGQGDFRTFTCLTCHRRREMDDEHEDERGYVYESARCLACHPRGRAP
jgi:hypothetical protein